MSVEATYRYTAFYRSIPFNVRKTFEISGSAVSVANEVAIEYAKHEMVEDGTLNELIDLHRFDKRGSWLIPDMSGNGMKLAVKVI